ncbi:SDR family NAD(P)-dependent oxidoreductase [Nonomuraea angiospora]|uniref:Short-subunit dehydrogenase n=1 Tax=Nonomuraea angiospora TaxID=46172 RepID=A0ABR9M629_9ACTN|nr:SDR family NAD(P)-dependent oxidoreductase [Nonomuraea angiospora]MBE1588299.1 short-subunit dehydrogenase [Nonomuraea angiospora]
MSTNHRNSGRPLALVTGASAGIGYQLALLFARNGYDLVATGRSDSIDRAAADFEQHGAHVVPVRADLSERDGVQVVWQAVQDTGRPLEAAVLNAGRSIGGAFLDTDLDDELDLLALNVTSVVALAKPVARHMADHGNGKILITSSLSATLPTPYETVYGPSRAFTYMFAEALRQEMKDRAPGVTVTALLPGATDSDFHARAGMGNTAFGPGAKKNSRIQVAAQGYRALMAGKDHVIGGDLRTKLTALTNRPLPEPFKAARHARKAQPRDTAPRQRDTATASR